MNDCEAIENEDYESFAKNLAKGGRPQIDHIIKLDTAKEMAMLERNEKGKQVRRYFIQVEKKYKEETTDLSDLSVELQAIIMHDKKIQRIETRMDKLEFEQEKPHNQMKRTPFTRRAFFSSKFPRKCLFKAGIFLL